MSCQCRDGLTFGGGAPQWDMTIGSLGKVWRAAGHVYGHVTVGVFEGGVYQWRRGIGEGGGATSEEDVATSDGWATASTSASALGSSSFVSSSTTRGSSGSIVIWMVCKGRYCR